MSPSVNKPQQDDVGEVCDVPAAATAASPFGVHCQRNRYQKTLGLNETSFSSLTVVAQKGRAGRTP